VLTPGTCNLPSPKIALVRPLFGSESVCTYGSESVESPDRRFVRAKSKACEKKSPKGDVREEDLTRSDRDPTVSLMISMLGGVVKPRNCISHQPAR
jgi:hypothetical protein